VTSLELPPLPEPLLAFRDLFREGRYWESHEALEDAWRESRSDLYHGLILYASAFVHAARDNAHGIVAQLDKTLDVLSDYPDAYLGVDVAAIREHARACRRRVEGARTDRGGGAPDDRAGDAPWIERLPTPTLDLDPSRVRGDEPELEAG
jgi:hypothetical protein